MRTKRSTACAHNGAMNGFVINPNAVRDISHLLRDAEGRLRVVPADLLAGTTELNGSCLVSGGACTAFPPANSANS